MKCFLLVLLSVALSGCGFVKGHQNAVVDYVVKATDKIYVEDNIIEERLEDVIESVTGLEGVDLSPRTPEQP